MTIEDALRGVSFAWELDGRTLVSIPNQYPSGALCTLDITLGRKEAHVSDMARGLFEASTLCDDTCFPRLASDEARRRGLIYENGAFIANGVDIGQLSAAVVAVGNASTFIAREAIKIDAEKKDIVQREMIFQKVRFAFPDSTVHRELELSGARAPWNVHNVVDLRDNRKAIFEPVKPGGISIATKFTMFSDLVMRPNLLLNAVVADPSNLEPKAQMLKEVANIVGEHDSIDVYRLKVG